MKAPLRITLSITIVMAMLLITHCTNLNNNYTYKWKVAVVYSNGDKDTLNCQYDSFNGNTCYVSLKISDRGLLSGGGTDPCIVIGCGFYTEIVACGVRRYEVVSLDKIPIGYK